MMLLVNKVPTSFDFEEVKTKIEQTYNCDVAAVLPHSDEMMALASAGVFVLHYPDHTVTTELQKVTASIVG
jgi:MinD-like ATPase involved in chromosome partitioning or flagellar assembly